MEASVPSAPRPTLDVLLGPGDRAPVGPADDALLAGLYEAPPGQAWVRANMVSSVDGAAWGPDHRSGTINDDADQRVFRVLRALADVVLIGAGTARAEGYTALDAPEDLGHLRAGRGRLELAVVSRSGRLPATLAESDRPPFVLTGSRGAAVARQALPDDRVLEIGRADEPDSPDLAAALARLAGRGLHHVLCEGGPHLLADLLAADLVDELCLTTTPVLVGAGPGRVVAGAAPAVGEASAPPAGARLAHLLHAQGTLLARWHLRAGSDAPHPAAQYPVAVGRG